MRGAPTSYQRARPDTRSSRASACFRFSALPTRFTEKAGRPDSLRLEYRVSGYRFPSVRRMVVLLA